MAVFSIHQGTRPIFTGLTTAAAVWETAAIGMAAGAGLPLLASVVTALHFVIVGRAATRPRLRIIHENGRGLPRHILASCTVRGWSTAWFRFAARDAAVWVVWAGIRRAGGTVPAKK